MADAVVTFAIEKLGAFLTQEINILIGARGSVIWLKNELSYLQESIRVLEEKQQTGHIRLWIDSVKDVANEAVIILEKFSAHQKEHATPKQGVLDRMRSCICVFNKEADLYDIGKEIESLKERFEDIRKKQDEFHISDIITTLNVQKRKRALLRPTSFGNKVEVVGFEDDVKTLLDVLVKDDPSLGMISIHGMGGLGKSTLASKLYHSTELSHFKSRAWVCVSEDYSIKDVLKKIIKSFRPDEEISSDFELEDLLRHLHKLLLGGDHYVVVIDDIWDIEVWQKIQSSFPDNNNGSRVIITTRNENIAQEVGDQCFVHKLRFLKDDESWQLFCNKAKPTQNLEKLGKEMVRKWGGLPLAIVVLSGLLRQKKSYQDWSDVKDNLWGKVRGKSSEIKEVLDLSYDDLSFEKRQCFLYLARFPEDHIFRVDRLKLLWIAEEFIPQEDGLLMEDVAKDYLDELIDRNMIQVAGLEFNGDVYLCRVHDLVRDLAIQKAKKQKLLGIFDSSEQHASSITLLQGQPRHAVYNGIGEYLNFLEPNSNDLKLRSIAVVTETGRLAKVQDINLLYSRFKNLKVLDLASVTSDVIPEEIGDLVLLKFLGLMKCENSLRKPLVVPPSIRKLKNLETLNGAFAAFYVFPTEICELKELRHVRFESISDASARGHLKISSDQSKLQTLGGISFKEWIQIDTINWTNLRTLVITDDSREENGYSLDSVVNLKNLQTFFLSLDCVNDTGIVIPTIKSLQSCKHLKTVALTGLMKDTEELGYLPDSVTCLTLIGSEMTVDPMPILGKLPNLTALDLMGAYMGGGEMVCSRESFPSLHLLKLTYMDMEKLQVEDGALPTLKYLDIHGCSRSKIIPPQIQHVPAVPDFMVAWDGSNTSIRNMALVLKAKIWKASQTRLLLFLKT